MAQYVPAWYEGDTITLTTSADVIGGQLVSISGDKTVAPSAAAATSWLGVAAFDAPLGTPVTIYLEGVQRLNGTGLLPGALVQAGAAGTIATGGTGDTLVGIVLGTDDTAGRFLVRLSR